MSRMRCLSIFVSLALVSSWTGFGARADWPQWRGPHRDGISPDKGLLGEWPDGGPPLAWKAQGIGHGFSSVSIAGSKIFTMGDSSDSSFIYALDLDGKVLWSAKVGRPGGDHPGT